MACARRWPTCPTASTRRDDAVNLGYLRVQTDMYRLRQTVLKQSQASRFAVSPALTQIADLDNASATREQLSDFYGTVKSAAQLTRPDGATKPPTFPIRTRTGGVAVPGAVGRTGRRRDGEDGAECEQQCGHRRQHRRLHVARASACPQHRRVDFRDRTDSEPDAGVVGHRWRHPCRQPGRHHRQPARFRSAHQPGRPDNRWPPCLRRRRPAPRSPTPRR